MIYINHHTILATYREDASAFVTQKDGVPPNSTTQNLIVSHDMFPRIFVDLHDQPLHSDGCPDKVSLCVSPVALRVTSVPSPLSLSAFHWK